jgi:hypothetical protein
MRDVLPNYTSVPGVKWATEHNQCLGIQSLLREVADISAYAGVVKTIDEDSGNCNIQWVRNESHPEGKTDDNGHVIQVEKTVLLPFSLKEVRANRADIVIGATVMFNVIRREGVMCAVNVECHPRKPVVETILHPFEASNDHIRARQQKQTEINELIQNREQAIAARAKKSGNSTSSSDSVPPPVKQLDPPDKHPQAPKAVAGDIWCGILGLEGHQPRPPVIKDHEQADVICIGGNFVDSDAKCSLRAAARELHTQLGIVLDEEFWTIERQQYLRKQKLDEGLGKVPLYRDTVTLPKQRVYYIMLPDIHECTVSPLRDATGRRIVRISSRDIAPPSTRSRAASKSHETSGANGVNPQPARWHLCHNQSGEHFWRHSGTKEIVAKKLPPQWEAKGWQLACQRSGAMLYWFNKITQTSEWRAAENATSPPGFPPVQTRG